jgi:hypothetical protein
MAQLEVSGTLASNVSPISSDETMFLDCTGVVRNAKSASSAAGNFSFEFEPSTSASLFQFGNTGDFDKPQRVAALDLNHAQLVRVELQRAKARVSNGFVIFLMLLCDASGRVIGRQRLPFWPMPAQAEFSLPAGTATASIRLGGSGSFEELKLRATVFRDRGAAITSQTHFTFVLRVPAPEKSDRWLELVPERLRPAIAGDIIAAQHLGITRLRRHVGSSGDHRDTRPSLDEILEHMLRTFRKDGLVAAIGQAVFDAPEPIAQSRLIEDFATRIEGIDRDSALRGSRAAISAARRVCLGRDRERVRRCSARSFSSAQGWQRSCPLSLLAQYRRCR